MKCMSCISCISSRTQCKAHYYHLHMYNWILELCANPLRKISLKMNNYEFLSGKLIMLSVEQLIERTLFSTTCLSFSLPMHTHVKQHFGKKWDMRAHRVFHVKDSMNFVYTFIYFKTVMDISKISWSSSLHIILFPLIQPRTLQWL